MPEATPIQRAIEILGSQAALAEAIGVTQALISQWVGGALVHQRHFPNIAAATGEKVTVRDLLDAEMEKLGKLNGRKRRA